MAGRDPRIDAYITNAQPFARPILRHLRTVIHSVSPEITETLKWSSPSFEYKGLLCGFAAFKAHATFGFWKHSLVVPNPKDKWGEAMGSFGRLTSVQDLPPESVLVKLVKKAIELNEDGVAAPHMVNRRKRKALPVPAYMKSALARDPKAKSNFDAFSPSQQREYVEWITEAKTDETRRKRLVTALEWIAGGKHRNWKYER